MFLIGFGIKAVNADSIPELRSELGHQLAEKSQKMNLRFVSQSWELHKMEND